VALKKEQISPVQEPSMKELVMRKLQRVALAAALAAGLGVAGTAASATTAAPAHRTPAATASPARGLSASR